MKPPIYCRILGYYRVWVSEKDQTRLQNLIFTEHVVAYRIDASAFYIPQSQKKRLLAAAEKKHIPIFCSGIQGMPELLTRYRTRIGIPIGALFATLLLVLGTHTVWHVEISGNETVAKETIRDGLQTLGFGIGSPTDQENYDQLIAAYRLKYPSIAWMGIYTQGTTAYVRVIENKSVSDGANAPDYPSNLVADLDGVIVRVEAEAGTPVVTPGTVVKKGDALVLGWVKGVCNDRILPAKGSVVARVSETICVRVPYEEVQKIEKERKIAQISVNFFEKRINIFKKNNTNATDYVIIEKEKPFRLLGGCVLPFGFSWKEAILYDEERVILDPVAARLRAQEELEARVRTAVGGGDILFRRVWEEEADDAIVLCALIEYTRNIAVSVPFTVS